MINVCLVGKKYFFAEKGRTLIDYAQLKSCIKEFHTLNKRRLIRNTYTICNYFDSREKNKTVQHARCGFTKAYNKRKVGQSTAEAVG